MLPRLLLIISVSIFFTGCNNVVQEIIENVAIEKHRKDSASEYIRDNPISRNEYEVLERKKEGDDSLYLVRLFLLTGEKYGDISYRNQYRDGDAKFFYKNGQVSHVLSYKKDTIVGIHDCYTPEGEKRQGIFAANGTGNIKVFHPITHKLIYEYTIKNKLKQGQYLTCYENGNKAIECFLANDTVVGVYRSWYKQGVLETERKEDKSNGLISFVSYYPTSKLKRTETWKNFRKQLIKAFDEQGRVTEEQCITNNNRLKGMKYFYGSGGNLLSKGSYLDEKKDGNYEYYYENGAKKAIETYLADTLLAETRWHENGNLSVEGKYKNNLLHGIYKEYYPNGKLKLQQEYQSGTKQGKYLSYFDNGNLYNDGFFENGHPKGDMKFYSRKGKLECTKNYK